MSNLQHPTQVRKPGAPLDLDDPASHEITPEDLTPPEADESPSPLAVLSSTVIKVPAPVLIDYLIDHLLVEHILIEWPVDIRPERILELMADHLADLPLEGDIPIPVDQTLDHLLEHLFEIEVAVEEDEEEVGI